MQSEAGNTLTLYGACKYVDKDTIRLGSEAVGIEGLRDPTADSGAATKKYVDACDMGLKKDIGTAIKETADSIVEKLDAHNEDTSAHADIREAVTEAKNAVTDAQAELAAHDTNSTMHVTPAERIKWNGYGSGKADLVNGKVPTAQLPAMNYAPAYSYGTEDLVAGESALAEGVLYFVYE